MTCFVAMRAYYGCCCRPLVGFQLGMLGVDQSQLSAGTITVPTNLEMTYFLCHFCFGVIAFETVLCKLVCELQRCVSYPWPWSMHAVRGTVLFTLAFAHRQAAERYRSDERAQHANYGTFRDHTMPFPSETSIGSFHVGPALK